MKNTAKRKTKTKAVVQATGRSVAYIQEVKGKRLGKPKAVVITTVRVRAKK